MSNPLESSRFPSVSSANVATNGSSEAVDTSLRLVQTVVEAAEDRKGSDITVLQMADVSYLADYFVIVTGFSSVQVRAIARAIEESLETHWNRRPLRTEGAAEGNWILQDFGEVIVHIFLPEDREFYNLEAFWGHAQRVEATAGASPKS